jgi:hypothetical protein
MRDSQDSKRPNENANKIYKNYTNSVQLLIRQFQMKVFKPRSKVSIELAVTVASDSGKEFNKGINDGKNYV